MPDLIETISKAYSFNLAYAKELVNDVPDDMIYRRFGDGAVNHPGFTIGHLCVGSALVAEHLGRQYSLSREWDDWFRRRGPGDPRLPSPHSEEMPSGNELVSMLTKQHQAVESCLGGLDHGALQEKTEWRLKRHFPSLLDYLAFMCISHEAMHLGQVAAWRRAAGLDSALARL
jgi:hypothetical protein